MQVNNDYYTNAYISAYNRTTSVQSTNFSLSGSYLEITGDASGSYLSGSDSVDVSTKAQELLDRIRELDVFSIIYPNKDATKSTKSLSEVEGDFMSDFNDFSSMFGKMSSMMGLDSSSSFTMGLNGVGGVNVTGSDSSSASQVQNAFNGNSTAVARFAVMAARASLADAGYTVDGFSQAYAEDPAAAIKDNIDALKERLLGFRTTGSNGSMQYGFMRDFNIEYSSTTASYSTAKAEDAEEVAAAEVA